MKVHTARAAALLAVVGVLAVACGDDDSDSGSAASTGAPAAEPSAEPEASDAESSEAPEADDAASGLKLTVWHNAGTPEPYINVYRRFAEATGHELELIPIPGDGFENQVLSRWATGERPDILEFHPAWPQLNPEENLQDLSNEDFVAISGNIYDEAGRMNGKIYNAITSFPTVFGVYYNKQVFEDAGLAPPESYDDMLDICVALQESAPDVAAIAEGGGSAWPTQILGGLLYIAEFNEGQAWADSVLAKETTMDAADSPFLGALTAYKQFQDEGCFNDDAVTAKYEDAARMLMNGEAAMMALHSDEIALFNDIAGGDPSVTDATLGFTAVSAHSPVVGWSAPLPGTWYAPKTGDADREAAALEFIRFATGPAYQDFIDESQTFPILDGFDPPESAQELGYQFKEMFDQGGVLLFNSKLQFPFDQIVPQLLAGQITPEEGAQLAQQGVAQNAAAQGLPGW
jgi:raffinose/stachyose/melibiose transport system substrate-binding protein